MKHLIPSMMVLLTACATPRTLFVSNSSQHLQDKGYSHHFQVERIQKKGENYWVTVRNMMRGKRYINCDHLPDSVKVGSYVSLR